MPEGAPSHDTFRRVFGLLDRNQFAANLFHWTQALQAATGGKLVAMNTDFAHVPHEMQATQATAHGRTTEHTYQAIEIQRDHPQRQKWRDLRTLVIATSCVTQNQEGPGRRGSSSADLAPRGKPLEQAIRKHWGIENSQHWVLDEAFHEDAARQQDRNGSANLAAVRRLIVSLLRQETTLQRGDKAKRMVCALDTDYLLKVFANANINA